MSYAPFPSNDGNEPHDPTRTAGLRLRDAEKIAANRLEGGGEGSLKDALAGVIANGAPRDDIDRLADRIGAAQAAYTAPSDAPTLPFLAETPNFGFTANPPAEPPADHTLLDLREWSDARAAVASELAEMQSQPIFLQAEQQQLGGGTHWQPTQQDAEPYHPPQDEPVQAVAPAEPEPEPVAEAPLPERPFSEPSFPEPPLPEPTMAEPPRPQPPSEASVTPITTALDAAAKLAADADAAAAALENLTRMLQAHQRPASVIPAPQHVAQRPSAPEPHPTPVAPRPAPPEHLARPTPLRPVAPENDPLQMKARPPRPEQRPVQLVPKPAAAHLPAARPVRPPTLRPTPMPRDSRQFDLRGFMAGFAFAWAIGAVLYIYLMAG